MADDLSKKVTDFYEKAGNGDTYAAYVEVFGPPDGVAPEARGLQALQDVRNTLGSGATAPGQEPDPDPWEGAYKDFHAERAVGADREVAMTAAFDRIFNAARAGDPRVAAQPGEDPHATRDRWMAQAKARQVRYAEARRSDAW